MYHSPSPLLVIRADAPALVTVNGLCLGECAGTAYATAPVGAGVYYVTASPLCAGRVPATRKLCFEGGRLTFASEDMWVCAWPGSVYECMLYTGDRPVPADVEEPPAEEVCLAVAFFTAVRDGREAEAMGYLTEDLRAELRFSEIREFLGPFSEIQPPFSDASGGLMGLLREGEGLWEAALYAMEYEGECIANIAEV